MPLRMEDTQFKLAAMSSCVQCGDVYKCIKCHRDLISGSLMKKRLLNDKDEYASVDRKALQPKDFLIAVLQRLKEDHFCVVKNLVPLETARNMCDEIETKYAVSGMFTPGKLSKASLNRVRSLEEVRGDSVMWVDGSSEEHPNISLVSKQMNKLALSLYQVHRISMSQISKSKTMVSCYDAHGASYKRHIDSNADGTLKLTFIFYLNDGFSATDGGSLRVHKDTGDIDITPELGRLVIFRSDKLVHEVLPTFKRRFAMTIWYMEVPKRKAAQPVGVEQMETDETEPVNKSPKICVQPKKMKIEQTD